MSEYLIDGGIHVDAALTNMAVEAFDGSGEGFVANEIFPAVPVPKQSDMYYTVDKAAFLRSPDTLRAPKTAAKKGEWKVSSDNYFCDNHAFRTDHAKESLANADAAIQIRQRSGRFVTQVLQRGRELRVANTVRSITNVGSGVALTGSAKWSDGANSDPIADVNTGHAFIENNTGLKANTAVVDKDTVRILRNHPLIRDYSKYTGAGLVPMSVLQEVFEVERILVASGIYNTAKQDAAASMSNIWGNCFFLAHVDRATPDLQTMTFGVCMRWTPEGFPASMAVERYDDADRSKRVEWTEAQYFQDEKIVAKDLSYLINNTL